MTWLQSSFNVAIKRTGTHTVRTSNNEQTEYPSSHCEVYITLGIYPVNCDYTTNQKQRTDEPFNDCH